jgi:hypothetical protein
MTDQAPLYEPHAIQDTFCTGLARTANLGPCRRLVFYAANGGTENHLIAKLVMTADSMQQVAALLVKDAPDTLDEPPRGRTLTAKFDTQTGGAAACRRFTGCPRDQAV